MTYKAWVMTYKAGCYMEQLFMDSYRLVARQVPVSQL